MRARTLLLGGPHDRATATVSALPERICVQASAADPGEPALYERVDDPDTGAPLGAYVWEGAPRRLEAVTPRQ